MQGLANEKMMIARTYERKVYTLVLDRISGWHGLTGAEPWSADG